VGGFRVIGHATSDKERQWSTQEEAEIYILGMLHTQESASPLVGASAGSGVSSFSHFFAEQSLDR